MFLLITALYIAPAIMYAIYFIKFVIETDHELKEKFPEHPHRMGTLGDYIISILEALCPVMNIIGVINFIFYGEEMKDEIVKEYDIAIKLAEKLTALYDEKEE